MLVPDIDPRWKKTGGVAPWSRSRVRGEAPVVASNEALEFEKVAAARPDLITAVEYDLKKPDYNKLSQLAPTVPPPKGFAPYTVPWDTMAVQVGASLGRRADAEELVKATRDRIAAAAEANPEFATSKAVLIDPDDDGGVYIFAENDVRTRFLGDLGLHHAGRDREAVQASSSTPRSAPSGSTCSTPPTCSCSSPRASRRRGS